MAACKSVAFKGEAREVTKEGGSLSSWRPPHLAPPESSASLAPSQRPPAPSSTPPEDAAAAAAAAATRGEAGAPEPRRRGEAGGDEDEEDPCSQTRRVVECCEDFPGSTVIDEIRLELFSSEGYLSSIKEFSRLPQ
ncbi:Hypothetical predicted protein [Podarcis lilfordi]|uniref:Uncharacterized protein n=1 Tax=Podarcis lilfordi TaxID=74358 RepID=A0AA35KA22_9SAUR|nr:Hypothetical predicted protein [Podarcis lilfordi]